MAVPDTLDAAMIEGWIEQLHIPQTKLTIVAHAAPDGWTINIQRTSNGYRATAHGRDWRETPTDWPDVTKVAFYILGHLQSLAERFEEIN